MIRHLKTLFAAVLLLALAAPLHAGWIEDGPDRTVIHLSLFQLPDPSRIDAPGRADAAVVREFVKRFPALFAEHRAAAATNDPTGYGRHDWSHVEVQLHQYSGIQVEMLESDLMAIAGGVAPDVLYVNFRKSDTYIRQGFLYPLDRPGDGYFEALTPEERELRIHPKVWPVIHRRGPDGERHVWAMPYAGTLGKVMLYRKDIFDRAGVPYPSNDWNWDDLLAACRKLSDPAHGIYALKLGRSQHESAYWINFLWAAGGDVMTYDDASDTWSIAYDSEAGAKALDFYTRLCTESWTDREGRLRRGYAYKDISLSQSKWERGELAIAFDYAEERLLSRINPDITGMAPLPKGPDGLRGAELNSRMMGLSASIKDRAVRDAAWEYIRFLDSKEASAIRTRIMVEGGFGRFIHPKYLRMFGYDDLIRLAPKGWEETFEITMAAGHPEPHGRNSNMAYLLMTDPLQRAEDLALAGKLPEDKAQRLAVMQDLLRISADKARRDMLSDVPAAERRLRDFGAAGFLLAMAVAVAFFLPRIARAFRPDTPDLLPQRSGHWRRYAWAYVLLVPAAATVLFWQYIPLLRGSVMAFQDYRLAGGSHFTGLANLGDVLWDSAWWSAVWNSFRYSVLIIALTFLPPLALAILLQETPRASLIFRIVFYLPAVMTGLVVMLLWKSFFEPSEYGLLNKVLLGIPAIVHLVLAFAALAFGWAIVRRLWFHSMRAGGFFVSVATLALAWTFVSLALPALNCHGSLWTRLLATAPEPIRWLTDSRVALFACVLPMAWAGVGPGSLIYLAALKGIPDDFYEAAEVDGAGFIDKILFVVFPMLKPLLIINFVGVFIGAWIHAGSGILAMTGGGANTEVADLHIFYKAYLFLQFGPATAMAWVLGFMLIGFTAYQLRMLARVEFKTGDAGK